MRHFRGTFETRKQSFKVCIKAITKTLDVTKSFILKL